MLVVLCYKIPIAKELNSQIISLAMRRTQLTKQNQHTLMGQVLSRIRSWIPLNL